VGEPAHRLSLLKARNPEGSWARPVDAGCAISRLGCQLGTVDDFASVLVRECCASLILHMAASLPVRLVRA